MNARGGNGVVWAVLFGGILLLGVVGFGFLIHNVRRFRFVEVLSRGNKAASRLVSAGVMWRCRG